MCRKSPDLYAFFSIENWCLYACTDPVQDQELVVGTTLCTRLFSIKNDDKIEFYELKQARSQGSMKICIYRITSFTCFVPNQALVVDTTLHLRHCPSRTMIKSSSTKRQAHSQEGGSSQAQYIISLIPSQSLFPHRATAYMIFSLYSALFQPAPYMSINGTDKTWNWNLSIDGKCRCTTNYWQCQLTSFSVRLGWDKSPA